MSEKYTLEYTVIVSGVIEFEAENEENARDQAEALFWDHHNRQVEEEISWIITKD